MVIILLIVFFKPEKKRKRDFEPHEFSEEEILKLYNAIKKTLELENLI